MWSEVITMTDTEARSGRRRARAGSCAGAGNAVYGLGWIGALVFYWQQADSFGEYLLAVLKPFVWPAFLVYEAFSALAS